MENLNLHKQKLYALIIAGVALICIFLPWVTVKYNLGNFGGFGGFGGGGTRSGSGIKGWEGILALLGVIAVVVASFMDDKTKEYTGNFKLIAMGGFGVVALCAIIALISVSSKGGGMQGGMVKVSAGIGLWLSIVAGIIGLLWIAGIIKVPAAPANKPPAPPQS